MWTEADKSDRGKVVDTEWNTHGAADVRYKQADRENAD